MKILALAATALAALAVPALAPAQTRTNGTDTFVADPSGPAAAEVPGDLFAAGNAVSLSGRTAGDAHLGGLDVAVEAPVGGNLYAAGANVALAAPVEGDATLAGWTVRLGGDGAVGGNARLAGGTVAIEAPVAGALTVAGADVTLDATVGGDAWIMAETLAFGEGARIEGRLTYSAPAPIAIPPEVVPPDRVTFEASDVPEAIGEARRGWEDGRWPGWRTAYGLLSGGLLGVAFLLVAGGLFLGLAPRLVERTRMEADARPGRSLLLGIAGLSLLFGLVPVLALSLIGLPLVPVALLLAIAGWFLGYLLGVYALARRLLGRLGGARGAATPEAAGPRDGGPLAPRVLVLAAGLVVAGLLNFVPFLGWAANFALVLLGLGAISARVLERATARATVAAVSPPIPPTT